MRAIEVLLRCNAFPDPTFLWWDVWLQPRFGTVEVRVMDAQVSTTETGFLAALVQSVARLEIEEGYLASQLVEAVELLGENRFLAPRDGMNALLLDPVAQTRVPATDLLAALVDAAHDHARDLGCAAALEALLERATGTGVRRLPDLNFGGFYATSSTAASGVATWKEKLSSR